MLAHFHEICVSFDLLHTHKRQKETAIIESIGVAQARRNGSVRERASKRIHTIETMRNRAKARERERKGQNHESEGVREQKEGIGAKSCKA